jgi:hypothetical protein
MYKVKNQNKIDWHGYDCSIYTLSTISELNFWLNLSYWLIEKICNLAVIDKVLLKFWAYFNVIYKWFEKLIDKKLWIDSKIIKVDITSPRFEDLVYKNFNFWIWLINWNEAYLKAVKRWIITHSDIEDMEKEWGWFGHNNCFWKGIGWTYIYEIYTWKKVVCPIEVLRYWVKKGVFYAPARTIWAQDTFTWEVIKLLVQARDNPNLNNLWKDPSKKKIEQKAFEILREYKWKKK